MRIVLGTHNQKKLAEMRQLLSDCALDVASLDEFPNALDVDETGSTFEENARLKAVEQATHLKEWVLAEDSGLSVIALDGEPGVFSARYAGEHGNDDANNAKLLSELSEFDDARRTAYYTCQLCLADPEGTVHFETTGRCYGMIGRELRGTHGFGYDPLFVIPEYHRTFAELGPATKRAISHRARAMSRLHAAILKLIAQTE